MATIGELWAKHGPAELAITPEGLEATPVRSLDGAAVIRLHRAVCESCPPEVKTAVSQRPWYCRQTPWYWRQRPWYRRPIPGRLQAAAGPW